MPTAILGKLIRALREERGLSQTQLAIDSSSSLPTIAGIERGTRKASPRVLIEVAHALGRIVSLNAEELASFADLSGLSSGVLVPSQSSSGFGGHGSVAGELLPLLSLALARSGRGLVEAVLRSIADPALVNTLIAAHQNTVTSAAPARKPAVDPTAPVLTGVTIHPEAGMKVSTFAPPPPAAPKAHKFPKPAKPAAATVRRRTA